MMQRLQNLIDLCLPLELRRLRQQDLLLRARALVGGLLLMSVFSLVLLLPMGWRFGSDPFFTRMMLPIALILFATATVALWLFKKFATFNLSTHLFAIVHTGVQLALLQVTGGINSSPLTFILALQPVLAFLMAGRMAGTAWLIIVIALSSSLSSFDNTHDLPQLSETTRGYLREVLWISTCFIFFGCIWYFDLINRHLALSIGRERDIAQFAAAHDPLTGLLNRASFSQRLLAATRRAQLNGNSLALIYIDLDGFKNINDSLGHHAGDTLLQTLGKRLQECVRNSDSVARLGGDEFGLLLEGASRTSLERILPNILERMYAPVRDDKHEMCVSASIGAALMPEDACEPDVLSRCADHAMYRAKSLGRNRAVFYSDTHFLGDGNAVSPGTD